MKQRIKNNELQFLRCATAWDCYVNLRGQLSKDGSEEEYQKLKAYEINGDIKVLKNTCFKSKHTHIGYATEDRDEFETMSSNPDNKHIVFTDRSESNISGRMKVVDETMLVSQVQGEDVKSTTDDSTKFCMSTSLLPCSCTSCRIDHTNHKDCYYSNYRRTKIQTFNTSKFLNTSVATNDLYGLQPLSVALLKQLLCDRGVSFTSKARKDVLIQLLTEDLDNEMERDDEGDIDD